jgi:hypothetical protein
MKLFAFFALLALLAVSAHAFTCQDLKNNYPSGLFKTLNSFCQSRVTESGLSVDAKHLWGSISAKEKGRSTYLKLRCTAFQKSFSATMSTLTLKGWWSRQESANAGVQHL